MQYQSNIKSASTDWLLKAHMSDVYYLVTIMHMYCILHCVQYDWCCSPTKGASNPSHLGGIIMGTLIAFPAATVDPSDT